MRALVLGVVLVGGGAARAEPAVTEVMARFSAEPSVTSLQRAAARHADVHPERVRSWLARVRKAALLPNFRARVGRGVGGVAITHGVDGVDRFSTVENDAWRFELEASWALDRLVFDPNELRLSREAQRVAARREQLSSEVAQLYFARRRLQIDALYDAGARGDVALERGLAIDELTAVLDGLTGGELSGRKDP